MELIRRCWGRVIGVLLIHEKVLSHLRSLENDLLLGTDRGLSHVRRNHTTLSCLRSLYFMSLMIRALGYRTRMINASRTWLMFVSEGFIWRITLLEQTISLISLSYFILYLVVFQQLLLILRWLTIAVVIGKLIRRNWSSRGQPPFLHTLSCPWDSCWYWTTPRRPTWWRWTWIVSVMDPSLRRRCWSSRTQVLHMGRLH